MTDYWNLELFTVGDYTLSAGRLTLTLVYLIGAPLLAWILSKVAYAWLHARYDLSQGLDRAALNAVRVVVVLAGLYLASATIGLNAVNFGSIEGADITVGGLLSTAIIFRLTWSLAQLAAELIRQWMGSFFEVSSSVGSLLVNLMYSLVIFAGFYIALSTLGFDLNVILFPLSAIGLGIGFGMQRIAENLASGVILLIERPVNDGDIITISGVTGIVQSIGLRATVIRKFSGSEVIMPNSELITHQLDNWTLSNTLVRIDTTVGVAYGSDPAQVMEILATTIGAHPDVMADPAPRVFFSEFGESSLNFRVFAWVDSPSKRLTTVTDLLVTWYQTFNEAGIEIPFPQRDLHVRSGELVVRQSPPT